MKKLTYILLIFTLVYGNAHAKWDDNRAGNQSVDTKNFGTNLSSADNTVQKALDTLDDFSPSISAGAVGFDELAATTETIQFTYMLDGGGSAIATGDKDAIHFAFPFEISEVTLLVDQSATMKLGMWKDVYANYPPTGADNMCASATPTVTAATASQDSTLTGWTTTVNAGDSIKFYVEANDNAQRCALTVKGSKI